MENKNEKEILMFKKLSSDQEFMKKYFYNFLDRFAYTTADIENVSNSNDKQMIIKKLLQAFKKAAEVKAVDLRPGDIIDVADIINSDNGLCGLRRTEVDPGELAHFIPCHHNNIYNSLYMVLDNYRNVWCDLDVFDREARFNIELMRIHPFEDGNKRTTKLILNANLFNKGMAPVIISAEDTQMYYDFLNDQDYDGLAQLLRMRSKAELSNMISMYKTLKDIPIDEDLFQTIEKTSDNLKH